MASLSLDSALARLPRVMRGVAACAALVVLLWPERAAARRFFRARFRPSTLELQDVGQLEIDSEMGGIYGDGQDGTRTSMPDFELGLGVLDWLEVNLDSSLSETQVGTQNKQFVGEPVWLSGRFDVYSFADTKTGDSFGIGAQVGPRLPNIGNARGVGVAALGLIGGGSQAFNVVLNAGSTLDAGQAVALTFGVDLAYTLQRRRKWTLNGEVAGAHYFGGNAPDQLLVNMGFGLIINDDVQLALLLLTGPVYRGDRVGLLVDLTYDVQLW
jgi:hypothetical protein